MKKKWLALIALIVTSFLCYGVYLGGKYFVIYSVGIKNPDISDIFIGMSLLTLGVITIGIVWYFLYQELLKRYFPNKSEYELTRAELHEIWEDGREFEALGTETDSFIAFDKFLDEFYKKNKTD